MQKAVAPMHRRPGACSQAAPSPQRVGRWDSRRRSSQAAGPRESCWALLPRVRMRSAEECFEAKLCREVCGLLAALLRNHPIVFLRLMITISIILV